MNIHKSAVVLLLAVLSAATLVPSEGTVHNVVTDWNSALQRTIRKLSIANQISSRYLSLVHLAQYQVSLDPRLRVRSRLDGARPKIRRHA